MSRASKRPLDMVAHGARLNLLAAARVTDINEAHLLVHGVLARAISNGSASATERDMDLAFAAALDAHCAAPDAS